MNERNVICDRRGMMRAAGLAAGAGLILGRPTWAEDAKPGTTPPPELTLMEDLTCQHAVVGRILMACQMGVIGQMQGAGSAAPPAPKGVAEAAQMLRAHVDDHHVKLEEDYIFPAVQKTGKFTDLISTLREQHAAARRLTDTMLQMTGAGSQNAGVEPLARTVMAYSQMIQAHTAYEETLLYPQFRTVLSDKDYEQLQKTVADADRKKLGAEGLPGLLAKVTDLEKSVGITGLAQFTPRLGEPVAREGSSR